MMTLEEQVEALTKKVQEQAEIIDYLTKKLYGQKSEKVDPNQLSLLDKDEGVF
ncbi:IS66 family transposase, partial [Staphylococcus xylosus]|nr:IS66 family transposase [Staphylococcus xylosus]